MFMVRSALALRPSRPFSQGIKAYPLLHPIQYSRGNYSFNLSSLQGRQLHTTTPLRNLQWSDVAKQHGKKPINLILEQEKKGTNYRVIDPPYPLEGYDKTEQEVFTFSAEGACKSLYLNRPHSLNSLNYTMMDYTDKLLRKWAEDSTSTAVTLRGSGPLAFSSGTDYKELSQMVKDGRFEDALDYLGKEYTVMHTILSSPKPFLGVMNGLAVGASACGMVLHSTIPITTEKAVMALPETGISPFNHNQKDLDSSLDVAFLTTCQC